MGVASFILSLLRFFVGGIVILALFVGYFLSASNIAKGKHWWIWLISTFGASACITGCMIMFFNAIKDNNILTFILLFSVFLFGIYGFLILWFHFTWWRTITTLASACWFGYGLYQNYFVLGVKEIITEQTMVSVISFSIIVVTWIAYKFINLIN